MALAPFRYWYLHRYYRISDVVIEGGDGWVLQRMGAFSVDREGCDRRAIRQATDLLTTGNFVGGLPGGGNLPLRVEFSRAQSRRYKARKTGLKGVWDNL